MAARNKPFNRWMAGDGARHFGDVTTLDLLPSLLRASTGEVAAMAEASRTRHVLSFTQVSVVERSAALLAAWQGGARAAASPRTRPQGLLRSAKPSRRSSAIAALSPVAMPYQRHCGKTRRSCPLPTGALVRKLSQEARVSSQ
jgi:hypothetical protein